MTGSIVRPGDALVADGEAGVREIRGAAGENLFVRRLYVRVRATTRLPVHRACAAIAFSPRSLPRALSTKMIFAFVAAVRLRPGRAGTGFRERHESAALNVHDRN